MSSDKLAALLTAASKPRNEAWAAIHGQCGPAVVAALVKVAMAANTWRGFLGHDHAFDNTLAALDAALTGGEHDYA